MTIQAIETAYRGRRFRSRIEARWAVFFDALGIEWEYEKEGYDLGGTRYLPDFWLPGLRFWVEIKGEHPSEDESVKARLLAEATKRPVYVFFGGMDLPEDFWGPSGTDSAYVFSPGFPPDCFDICYRWTECPECHALGIQFEARSDRLDNHLDDCPRATSREDAGHNGDSPRLIAAYTAALGARFEQTG